MTIALYAIAAVFAALLLATLASSGNWLAAGIRGTVRQGVLGATFLVPVLLIVGLIGFATYGIVASILYIYTM
jgi:hypothetical protein